jgi:putative oxidoreductase
MTCICGFLLFMPPPPPSMMPPVVVQWNMANVQHTFHMDDIRFSTTSGYLLLLNRYVLIALIILAGVLINIVAFHITMWPQTLFPLPIVAVILWFLTCWPIRDRFAPLFTPKVYAGSVTTVDLGCFVAAENSLKSKQFLSLGFHKLSINVPRS